MKKHIENLFSARGMSVCGVGSRSVLFLMAMACALGIPRVARAAYQNMGSDRVLLMNNDSRLPDKGGITGQGYWDTNTTVGTTYWTHMPNNDAGSRTRTLQHGTEHILYSPDHKPLWHLVDCRAGYVPSGTSGRNAIPYSKNFAQASAAPSANFIDDSGKKINTIANAANATVIMRDSKNARMYSPYYRDGIGTIYFDTVNSYVNAEAELVIQVATNLTAEAIAFNEENPTEAISFDEVDEKVEFSKWDDYYNWQAIPLTVLEVNSIAVTNTLNGATNLVLRVKDGGKDKQFYRVRTQLNYYGPIRFRVLRNTESTAAEGSDTASLVLIDNVMVSYPPMTIKLNRTGDDYDEKLRGLAVLGCIGDFDKPFLTYADKKVNAQISFSWVTNFQNTAIETSVRSPTFNYRWRYLDQKVNPWRTVSMTTNRNVTTAGRVDFARYPNNTNFFSVAGIPLQDGVGDLEYYFSVKLYSAPCYKPVDFINDDFSVFGTLPNSSSAWSEQIQNVTCRLNVSDDFRTPALGRDYFTRIREGISDYKWVELCTTVTTNGTDTKTENLRMELVGDHIWRYHYYVPTNMVGETFSFHFRGEELYTNAWVNGYQHRTNVWNCELRELPYIPYTAAAGLGYRNDISCKLDEAATHLLIEFNDELLSFSVSHASYQNFNAWTDATAGYVGHTNWNGEGAIGVSDTKQKYTLEMSSSKGWENSSFDSALWYEPFDTSDFITYPFDKVWDEHATPNGWTAGHGHFIRSQRGQDEMALQLEGRGQGWIGMDNFQSDQMPHGIDQVQFWARLAQEPRFDDFAWYMDGISATNYAICALVSMGHKGSDNLRNPGDISPGNPSISLVGYYRPTVGCYEFRITRCGQEQLCAAIYKWTPGTLGMTSTMLASNVIAVTDREELIQAGSGQPRIKNFGNYLVPNSGNADGGVGIGSRAYLLINKKGATVNLVGALSTGRNSNALVSEATSMRTLVYITDTTKPLTKGSFGVGSTDCAATFNALSVHSILPTGVTNINTAATFIDSTFTDGDWAYFSTRWKWDEKALTSSKANIHAVLATNQTIKLEFKTANDSDGWKPSGHELIINSFSTNQYTFTPRVSPSYQVRLRTGGTTYDEVRTDLVVDEIRVRAWQASNYPGLAYNNAEYTEWVYTQGVVEKSGADTVLRLQPSRAIPTVAQGLRSPFLGNGISMFSCDYKNGTDKTKLLLQVCTNLVSRGGVSETLTCYPPENYNWTTVTNWDFSKMTAAARASGTLTYYMSFRAPIKGLIRLVMASDVIQHCIDEEGKPTRSIDYGQVTITGAYCYDEPALDMRSWYAWNFHTAGWNTEDKRFAYLFDSPDGLSGSLNYSAMDRDNTVADAQGIGLSDRSDIAAYQGNNAFVQCPPMTNGIGTVSFRARTFDTNATHKAAWVTLYGSFDPDDDQVVSPASWTRIKDFEITNTTYQTFSWKTTDDNSQFHAIRLETAGSRHGRSPSIPAGKDHDWERPKASQLQRVFIDEISVGEPIQPRIVFRNVRPFRSGVVDIPPGVVSNVTDLSEQPLFGESWGLQCTIEPQQMGDELDRDSIKVYAAFKCGTAPWGYVNWSNQVTAVRLDRIGDTLTYRSTWNTPASIISPVDTLTPGTVWQYFVWCEFKDKAGNAHRHSLNSTDWSVPSWYFGLQDFNELYKSQGFAGYTILDTISPKRAWINEINLADVCSSDNIDGQKQFIEVAVPRGADITGWRLNVISSSLNRGAIATYGAYDAKIGSDNKKYGTRLGVDWTNDYTVVALRSPEARNAGFVNDADGNWSVMDATTCESLKMMSSTSSFKYYENYGIELVRPSGVVEHQIVVQGQNPYAGYPELEKYGSGTNLLAKVRALDGSRSEWFFAGVDETPATLGVFKSHGESADCWTNILVSTPAKLNMFEDGTRQLIDPGWFLQPKGTNVWIYATVLNPHIHQAIGVKTNATEVFIIRKGDTTNIVYTADKWWALGKVTTNDVTVAAADGRADLADNHKWTLTLPKVTDTLTIYADAKPGKNVTDVGLDSTDPYFPAVMHWLSDKDDTKGIHLAKYLNLNGTQVVDKNNEKVYLGLRDMYWLDIDPTQDGWALKAGMGHSGGDSPILPVYVTDGKHTYTNSRVVVTMMITNTLTKAVRKPDHLLGLEPGSNSRDYTAFSPSWTSVTFKVTGALRRSDASEIAEAYYPLRWFVFTPESFDDNYQAVIDLWDPHSENSPGYFYGWSDFPGVPVWYKFLISADPAWYDTAEPLKAKSTYSE